MKVVWLEFILLIDAKVTLLGQVLRIMVLGVIALAKLVLTTAVILDVILLAIEMAQGRGKW